MREGSPARIVLAGAFGYGAVHRTNLARLQSEGRARLVAIADPSATSGSDLEAPAYPTLEEALERVGDVDVVVVATPLHTHGALAEYALRHGSDVLLEKPPVASMAAFERLLRAQDECDRVVQVGFQSLGSAAVAALTGVATEDTAGPGRVTAVGATGLWMRRRAYWARSNWAGKRTLDGVEVMDGVATNPLAHAIATALRIAGARTATDVASVQTDLYRANGIEADDTSVVRIRLVDGPTITCALTLCAAEQLEPYLLVHGTTGDAKFFYREDRIVPLDRPGPERRHPRVDLLENLLAHRLDGSPLLSSLRDVGAFMTVVEAIRTAEPPTPIDGRFVSWRDACDEAHPVVEGVERWVERSVRAHATFHELGAPWARPRPDERIATLALHGVALAEVIDGRAAAPASVPRPYLHPVRTLAGTVVSDHHPADHDWHLGVGVAIQDVAGTNLWGGRTFTAAGYRTLDDHGRIASDRIDQEPGRIAQDLTWHDQDGAPVLRERRTITARGIDERAWRLGLAFELSPAAEADVRLGSPGSNGRDGGGYGGFFWRLPAVQEVDVRTADGHGERGVHGATADWIAWSADFSGRPATLILLPGDDRTAVDPWFVRVAGYPGIGSALAWDSPVVVRPGAALRRSIIAVVADGRLDDDEVADLVGQAGR